MRHSSRATFLLVFPLCLWLFFFFLIPLVSVLFGSVYETGRGLTLKYFITAISERINLEALKNSLILASTTTVLGVTVGAVLSYLIHCLGERLKSFFLSMITVPLTFSGLVIAYAFIVTFGSSGTLTLLLGKLLKVDPSILSSFLYTWKGLALAYLYFLIPRMVLTMMAAWVNMDWSLVEAAESLGAGPVRILLRVVLPHIWPSLLAGSALLFAVAMGAFGTAFALVGTGVNILPLLIYTQVSDVSYNLPLANALSMVLTLVTTIFVYAYQRLFVTSRETQD